jgi:hypothetical protein
MKKNILKPINTPFKIIGMWYKLHWKIALAALAVLSVHDEKWQVQTKTSIWNHSKADADNDKIGDECDPDADNDGIPNQASWLSSSSSHVDRRRSLEING